MSTQQPKLDTPLKLKDIEEIAKAFQAAKEANPNLIPAGDHWQGNFDANFYLGMATAMNLAIRGLMNSEANPDSTIGDLINEFNLVSGQLAEMIVAKSPKITVVDK